MADQYGSYQAGATPAQIEESDKPMPGFGSDSLASGGGSMGGGGGGGSSTFDDLNDPAVSLGSVTSRILYGGIFTALFYIIHEPYNRYIRYWAWLTLILHAPLSLCLVISFLAWVTSPFVTGAAFFVFLFLHVIFANVLSYWAYKGARDGSILTLPVVTAFCVARAQVTKSYPLSPTLQWPGHNDFGL